MNEAAPPTPLQRQCTRTRSRNENGGGSGDDDDDVADDAAEVGVPAEVGALLNWLDWLDAKDDDPASAAPLNSMTSSSSSLSSSLELGACSASVAAAPRDATCRAYATAASTAVSNQPMP